MNVINGTPVKVNLESIPDYKPRYMKPYVKLYFDYFGYDISSFVPCEWCGARAVDIHHIRARKAGGTKKPDTIENLMALCREHHYRMGDRKDWIDILQARHDEKLKQHKP